jgi:hypothetical protein
MIVASVGVGTGEDAYKVSREAAIAAVEGLPNKKPKLVIVFGSVVFDQDQMLQGIHATTPEALVVGCSTAGEISTEGLAMEKSVVVMAIESDQMDFWGGIGNHLLWNPRQAGIECANAIQYASNGYVRSCLMFLDVISGNGELGIAGMREKLGPSIPLYGSAAADDLLFFKTYQYFNSLVFSGSMVGLGMSGTFTCAAALADSFLPIGIPRVVTKASGVTVQEIDHKPAFSMYEDYFGTEHSLELRERLLSDLAVTFPLGIFDTSTNSLISRNPIYADQEGGMVFTAQIPEGAEAHLMISDTEQAFTSAKEAAEKVMRDLGGKTPRAVIVMNSVARRQLLGANADEEIRIIQAVIGRDVPLIGFYGYAQVDNVLEGRAPFHNAALIIWAIAE